MGVMQPRHRLPEKTWRKICKRVIHRLLPGEETRPTLRYEKGGILMASVPEQPQMKKTLGLTGLTMNAMALIAPGAFLWLTFAQQSQYGAPMAGSAIWFGILAALMLCFATAIAYAELSKLYPRRGSSYFFAEQAFLSKTNAYKFARLSKFIIGWASHLYYWLYPGVMVGVTAILVGYLAGQLFPDTFNGTINSQSVVISFRAILRLRQIGVLWLA